MTNGTGQSKFNNVKNLSDDLKRPLSEYATITSVAVMSYGDGTRSKYFEFVNFLSLNDAAIAVEALYGNKIDEKEYNVG
ncbi:polyadenylate-binding protein 2-like protein [Tanacetum coccineum]